MNIKKSISIILIKIIDIIISRYISKHTQNIRNEISSRALKSTVDYVEINLKYLDSVDSKWKVHDIALQNVVIDGLYLEFGVFKGDTINYISKKTNKTIYGFDSFEGLPEFWRDGFPKYKFKVKNLPNVNNNVILIKGWFDSTLPHFIESRQSEKIAYLHIDCDLYSSTKVIFDTLKNNIVSGTVIVFDEYFNYPNWEIHEFKAFQEYILENQVRYEYITYNNLHEQVAIKIL